MGSRSGMVVLCFLVASLLLSSPSFAAETETYAAGRKMKQDPEAISAVKDGSYTCCPPKPPSYLPPTTKPPAGRN
ncbi:hypothetical protein ACP4OV_001513 [Aristida adscensionis]